MYLAESCDCGHCSECIRHQHFMYYARKYQIKNKISCIECVCYRIIYDCLKWDSSFFFFNLFVCLFFICLFVYLFVCSYIDQHSLWSLRVRSIIQTIWCDIWCHWQAVCLLWLLFFTQHLYVLRANSLKNSQSHHILYNTRRPLVPMKSVLIGQLLVFVDKHWCQVVYLGGEP